MAVLTVKQTGGDYSSLAAAEAAAGVGDELAIQGLWTVDDTTAVVDDVRDLSITTDSDSRHPGYWDESQQHYRLVVSGSHALHINGVGCTIEGVAIEQAGTGTSDEACRCTPGSGDTATLTNCILRCSQNVDQGDVLYTGFNSTIGTITLDGCMLYGAGRGGIHIQNFYSTTNNGTINVNSCFIWNCGRYGTPGQWNRVGGGITYNVGGGDGSGFTINEHNNPILENDTGGSSGGNAPSDRNAYINSGTGIGAWNVSYSIDSDGSIATDTDGGSGNLASRTLTDNTSPGAGDWVIVEDITSSPYDLRLVDNVENDAQDMHTTATAHGLTISSTDIAGTSRPQATNYDCGPFEIVSGSSPQTITPSGIVSVEAFGSHTAVPGAVSVSPTAVAGAEAFGATVLQSTISVSPPAVASLEAFGSPALAPGVVAVSPTAIASAETFGATVLSALATIVASGMASGEAFGTAVLSALFTILAEGAASIEAFGSPTISPGAVIILPGGIAGAESFGTAVISSGGITVAPGGIVSLESFGSASLNVGVVIVLPGSITSLEAFGTAVVSAGGSLILPGGIEIPEAFGAAVLTPGGVTLLPSSIAGAEAFGSATISAGVATIQPGGIASLEAFGTAVFTPGATTILTAGVDSAEAFGTAVLSSGIVVEASAIGSAEAFGSTGVTATFTLLPDGVASAEAFGSTAVSPGTVTLILTGIGSGEAFGTLIVSAGAAIEIITLSGSFMLNEALSGSYVLNQSLDGSFRLNEALAGKL